MTREKNIYKLRCELYVNSCGRLTHLLTPLNRGKSYAAMSEWMRRRGPSFSSHCEQQSSRADNSSTQGERGEWPELSPLDRGSYTAAEWVSETLTAYILVSLRVVVYSGRPFLVASLENCLIQSKSLCELLIWIKFHMYIN